MTRKDRNVLGGEMNEYSPGDGLAARRLDLVITRTDTMSLAGLEKACTKACARWRDMCA